VHWLVACRVTQAHAIRVIPGRPSGNGGNPGLERNGLGSVGARPRRRQPASRHLGGPQVQQQVPPQGAGFGWCTCSTMARPLTCGCSGAPPTWLIWATGTPAAVSRLVWCALGIRGGSCRGWRSGRCGCEHGRGWWRSGDPSITRWPRAGRVREGAAQAVVAGCGHDVAVGGGKGLAGHHRGAGGAVSQRCSAGGVPAGRRGRAARHVCPSGRQTSTWPRPAGPPSARGCAARKRGRRTRQRDPWPPGISRMLRSRLTSGAPGTGPNAEQSEPGPAVPASADRTRRAGRPCAPARTLPPCEVSDSHLSSMIVAGCAVHASAWPTTAGTSASP
jgi:hypothetical protein